MKGYPGLHTIHKLRRSLPPHISAAYLLVLVYHNDDDTVRRAGGDRGWSGPLCWWAYKLARGGISAMAREAEGKIVALGQQVAVMMRFSKRQRISDRTYSFRCL